MTSHIPIERSLAARNPELAAEWDWSRNHSDSPESVAAGSPSKFFWLCSRGHSYEASCAKRRAGRNCPYCSNQRVLPGFNDLATKFPEVAKTWDFDRNPQSPSEVGPFSTRKFFWICGEGHSFETQVYNRTNGSRGCPFCSGHKVLLGFNDLATNFPYLADEWHPTRNSFSPGEITTGSGRRVWWVCPIGHDYESAVCDRTRKDSPRGCPYCSGQKVLAGFNDLQSVAPELAAEWDYGTNKLTPDQVSQYSRAKVGWVCAKSHRYQANIYARKAGNGCPVCSNKAVLQGVNDLATLYPGLVGEWDIEKNLPLSVESIVAKGGHKKLWWKCSKCRESYASTVSHRLEGTGCPTCAPYGFNPSLRSVLYFLENPGFSARKIGVTNLSDRRKQRFERFGSGWELLFKVEGTGEQVLELEREAFSWLRGELGLGVALSKLEMGSAGGETETFPLGTVSNAEIIDWLSARFKALEQRERT